MRSPFHLSSASCLLVAHARTAPSAVPTMVSLVLLLCPSYRPSCHSDSISSLRSFCSRICLHQTFSPNVTTGALHLAARSPIFADHVPGDHHRCPSYHPLDDHVIALQLHVRLFLDLLLQYPHKLLERFPWFLDKSIWLTFTNSWLLVRLYLHGSSPEHLVLQVKLVRRPTSG